MFVLEREKPRDLALNRDMTTQITVVSIPVMSDKDAEKEYTWRVGDPEDGLALPHNFSVLL